MSDEKDRLGDKLRDLGAAREDQWAHRRDTELLALLRERLSAMVCPICKALLSPSTQGGIDILKCPHDHGVWVSYDNAEKLLKPRN